MRPSFDIKVNSNSLPPDMTARISTVTLQDEVGVVSDQVTILFADPKEELAVPRLGVTLDFSIGYKDELVSMGRYTIDEVRIQPGILEVVAKGFNSKSSIKERRTGTFQSLKLFDVVSEIANRNSLTLRMSDSLKTKELSKLYMQRSESDLFTLSRLAKSFGASMKVEEARLLFLDRGKGKTVSGSNIESIIISRRDCDEYTFEVKGRDDYNSVKVKILDTKTGKITKKVFKRDAKGTPTFTMDKVFRSEKEAEAEAKAALKDKKFSETTLSLTLPGRPDLRAEARVTLTGFREGLDGEWTIEKSSHPISDDYKTTIELKRFSGDD